MLKISSIFVAIGTDVCNSRHGHEEIKKITS